MSAVLGAFAPEINRFNRALSAVAQPFGSPTELDLIQSHNALTSFMAATADPTGFSAVAVDPAEDLKKTMSAYAGRPFESAMVIDVAWLDCLMRASTASEERPSIRTLVPDLLQDSLQRRMVGHGLLPLIPYVTAEAVAELNQSIWGCGKVALIRRLMGASILPDFADVAAHTVTSIVAVSITARLLRDSTLRATVGGFEALLNEGLLPLGWGVERGRKLPYGVKLYKEADTDAARPHAFPLRQTVIHGTLMGLGPRMKATPRYVVMASLAELAEPMKLNLNDPFRVWNSFMNRQVEGKAFQFGPLGGLDVLATIHLATGHQPSSVYVLDPQSDLVYGLGCHIEDHAQAQKSVKHLDPRKRPTIVNPLGSPIWLDPYDDERLMSHARDRRPAFAFRDRIREMLESQLLPALEKSLQGAGVIHAAFVNVISATILQTFFRLFVAAFEADRETEARAARLIDLYNRGVIPIGIRDAKVLTVAKNA